MTRTRGNAFLWWLILSMAMVAVTVTAATIAILYRTAYTQTLQEMEHSAETLASLMEAVAQFDHKFSANDHPQGARGATLSQIAQGLKEHRHAYNSEELIIGEQQSDAIRIMHRVEQGRGIEDVTLLKNDNPLAQPLRRALSGASGSGELLDYKGVTVLAGYAPVPTLGVGVAYKIDLTEMRAPYVAAAIWAGIITLVAVGLGAALFSGVVRPFLRRVEAQEQRLRDVVLSTEELAHIGSWERAITDNSVVWSPEMYRLRGLDPATTTPSFELAMNAIHPEDLARVQQNTDVALRTGEFQPIEYRLQRPDGATCFIRAQGVVIRDAHGTATHMRGFEQDITARVSAENEIRQVRDRLQFIIDASPDWIFAKDLQFRFLLVNKAFAQAQGLTAQEMLGRPDTDFWSKELCEGNPENGIRGFHEDDRQAFSGELTHNAHDPATFDDGGLHVLDTLKGPLRDNQGNIVGVFSYSRDITQHIEAEERYQSVVAAMAEGVVVMQADGHISGNNLASEDILGLSADQMRGRTAMDPRWSSVHKDGSPFPGNEHPGTVTLQTGQSFRDVLMGVDHPTKGRRWISINAVPLIMPGGGKPYGSAATFTDVTERKAAEDALKRSEQQLKEINESLEERVRQRTAELADASELNARMLATSTLGFAAYRSFGPCVFANAAIGTTIGATPEQVLAQNFRELQSWRENGLLDAAELVLATGTPQMREVGVTTTFGKKVWLDCIFARFMRAGEPHILLMVSDISARKKAEAALIQAKEDAERANKTKSAFLSRMSHELRTPMNAILGFAQILEMDNLPPEQADFVHEIHHAGDHLLKLINELLDLARIESGKLVTVLEPVNLKTLVGDAIQIIQPSLAANRITLHNHCDPRATVLADPTRLKQILLNLLSNAVKYNVSGGTVSIGCQAPIEGRLRIAVADTGPGIAADKLSLLFKPFERLGAEYSAVDGAGIGLALSKQLAELMNGILSVQSTTGEGSVFSLELPTIQMAPEADRLAAAAPGQAVGLKNVLYVEDNAANLRVVEAIFRHHTQLRLISATNGEVGLQLAQRYQPDAILLDIHLPGMDGYAVLKALQADPRTRHIPVVALSADAMPIDVEKGLAAGFLHYITKPFDIPKLLDIVNRVLSKKS